MVPPKINFFPKTSVRRLFAGLKKCSIWNKVKVTMRVYLQHIRLKRDLKCYSLFTPSLKLTNNPISFDWAYWGYSRDNNPPYQLWGLEGAMKAPSAGFISATQPKTNMVHFRCRQTILVEGCSNIFAKQRRTRIWGDTWDKFSFGSSKLPPPCACMPWWVTGD